MIYGVKAVPPLGPEQSSETRGKQASAGDVPPSVPPSPGVGAHRSDPGAEELLALWASLDDAERADLLVVARGLTGGAKKFMGSRGWPHCP